MQSSRLLSFMCQQVQTLSTVNIHGHKVKVTKTRSYKHWTWGQEDANDKVTEWKFSIKEHLGIRMSLWVQGWMDMKMKFKPPCQKPYKPKQNLHWTALLKKGLNNWMCRRWGDNVWEVRSFKKSQNLKKKVYFLFELRVGIVVL